MAINQNQNSNQKQNNNQGNQRSTSQDKDLGKQAQPSRDAGKMDQNRDSTRQAGRESKDVDSDAL